MLQYVMLSHRMNPDLYSFLPVQHYPFTNRLGLPTKAALSSSNWQCCSRFCRFSTPISKPYTGHDPRPIPKLHHQQNILVRGVAIDN